MLRLHDDIQRILPLRADLTQALVAITLRVDRRGHVHPDAVEIVLRNELLDVIEH